MRSNMRVLSICTALFCELALVLAVEAKSPVATGKGGAVATIDDEATHAAMEILDDGGNAIDASIAAAATLGVTNPFSCGIGGGGFMLIYLAADHTIIVIDFRETAPASVTPALFLNADGSPIPFEEAVTSGRSVGVPGTVRGWYEALSRYGTMTFAQVLRHAIRVAEEGFIVGTQLERMTHENQTKLARFTSTSKLYLPRGKPISAAERLVNADMAHAYRVISECGVRAFYTGAIAKAIVDAVNHPPAAPGVNAVGALMTMADLRDYEVRFRKPIVSTYRGYTFYGAPSPSSGGIAVAEALNILETFNLVGRPRAEVEHLYLEASRLAFADRDAYLGDPEFVDLPVIGLLSKAYARGRAALIDPTHAGSSSVDPGDPFLFQQDPSFPLRPSTVKVPKESTQTTHFAVCDRTGNIVACTFTIEAEGGSGIVVPGWGFILNNELTDFSFVGPNPNVPEPGKRPRSSMSPTIALRDGHPTFTIGSPGGATIITTVLQTIVNHIDLGMPLEQALAAPRLSQRNEEFTEIESTIPFAGTPQAVALEALGYRWKEVGEIGAANGIEFHPDGTVTAVSEPVRHGVGSALVQEATPR
jgi:gamma-glutamyltranspeptidase/glutathione hydrolase